MTEPDLVLAPPIDGRPGLGSLVERYALPPGEIEATSLRLIREAMPRNGWSEAEQQVVQRMAYACGDIELANLVRFHAQAVTAAVAALRGGADIIADVRAVEVSLDRGRMDLLGSAVFCAIEDPSVVLRAKAERLPRAVLAMRWLAPHIDQGVVVIGTAPTALLAVLDLVDSGTARPALIVGTPVGLVAARESKMELMARDVPYIAVEGTRGGAALASAATNALLRLATDEADHGAQPIAVRPARSPNQADA